MHTNGTGGNHEAQDRGGGAQERIQEKATD